MKKILLTGVTFMLLFLSITISAQTSTLYFTNTGGSFTGEKWISITTGPDNTGTVIWSQGDGTIGNASGLLTDQAFTVTDGVDFYVNCYDQYDDSWDGTTYEVRDASGGGGILVINNGGVSPSDGADTDATSGWDATEEERETSELGNYTPPACTPGAGSVVLGSCTPGNGVMLDVSITDLGDGTIVISNDGGVPDMMVTSLSNVSIGPFAFASNVTITLEHPTDAVCNVVLSTVSIPSGCPPANDDCAGAFPLQVNADLLCGAVTAGTNENSTPSPDTDDVTGNPNTDVWYSFVATSTDHRVELSNVVYISGGTFASTDMGMGLYDGTGGCSALVFVTDSDPNIMSATGLTIGATYYLRVYNWSSTVYFNSFDICVGTIPPPPPPPANDDCAGAFPLTVNPDLACGVVTAGTNEGSTPSPDTDDVTGNPNTDVWYSFVATSTAHVIELLNVVYISGGTFASTDMGMGLYDGSGGCSALVLVTDSDPNTMNAIGLTIGTTYYLRVYNWSSTVYFDSFDVCVGTEACTAPSVTATPDLTSCPNVGIDIEFTDLGTGVSFDVIDDQGGATQTITALGVYSFGPYPDGTSVIFTIEFSDANGPVADCDVTLPAVTISCPPANDDCANAIPVAVGEMICDGNTTNGDNTAATAGADPVGSCFNGGSNGVWFSFVAPASGDVSASTDFSGGTNDDTEIAVYDDCAGTNELGCSQDEGVVVNGFGSYLSIIPSISGLTPGDTYFILVSGYSGTEGTFCLEVNENGCDAATNLELPPMGTAATITAIAGSSCDDPTTGWTYYEDPATGDYMFAIDWGTTGSNDPAKAAAEVTIEILAAETMAEGGVAGVSGPACWSMARFWDVDLGGAAIVDAVSVRFYYDPAEKTTVEMAAMSDGRTAAPSRWFKTTTGAYTGTPTPGGPANELDLTGNLVTDTGVEDTYTYAEFSGIMSFSGGTFVTGVDAVVPVELHSLKGRAHEKHNTISWSTASEFNNDYQMLQTSYDGNSNWIEVDRVKASNRNELSHYSIQDDRPRMESYYRVKSVDFDGYTAYSNTIMVDRSRYGVKGISALVSPNPFNDRFEVTLESDTERKVSLTLLDIQGRVIVNKTMNLANGINKNTMSMEQYETGIYLLRIATDDYEEVIKLVKN